MKAVLLTFNWKTEEVLHEFFEGESAKNPEAFLASIKDDFPENEGWNHIIVRDPEACAYRVKRWIGEED